MEESKVYVSLTQKKVYLYPDESPWEFKITAYQEIVPVFEKLFQQLNYIEVDNFFRAHIPFIPYHKDKENDQYDERMMKLYALIHEYTDEDSKRFIEQLPYFREANYQYE